MTPVPDLPDTLPLVLRPSRRGTVAAFGVAFLFGVVGLFFALSGSVTAGGFSLLLAGIGLFAGVVAVLPKRSELRLDDEGFAVVSPVKSWKAGWSEIEEFVPDTVDVGRRGRAPVVRVVYRDGFAAAHEPSSLPGKALGVDEHYVTPAYGNLDNAQLCRLLTRFLGRYGE